MSRVQLGKLWVVVSAVLTYYALNSWIVAQGGNEIFGAKLVVSKGVPTAIAAIPVCAVLLIMSSLIGREFAGRGGSQWHERIPVVGFEEIDTSSRDGRLYQGAMVFVFSLLPAVAMIYFWHSFLSAKIMLNDGSKKQIESVWDWTTLTTLNDPARICTDFDTSLPNPCAANATVLPGLEPTIFAILTGAALLALLGHWRRLLWATPTI